MFHRTYECIEITHSEGLTTLTMNRPANLNAVDAKLHKELSQIFIEAQEDMETEVIILTGAGRAFSAGGDFKFLNECQGDPERFNNTVVEGKQIINSIVNLSKPLISRINGDAVGLGATIALLADFSIAVKSARIGDPHVKIGLAAGDGGAMIWPQLVGYVRAKRYLMTGELILAEEAARIGLITEAVDEEMFEEAVQKISQMLLRGPKVAIRETKAAINSRLKHVVATTVDLGFAGEALTQASGDHTEALAAIRDRRPPRFGASRR